MEYSCILEVKRSDSIIPSKSLNFSLELSQERCLRLSWQLFDSNYLLI